ncbi:hypothetical protein [Amycolatopsis sp.]|uniref:hypothetical protein n=1 Tax=Amycolatopsis sp. TaxID=37632 RepID=UPI002C3F4D5D|nr:hypothetical protein [Amycolatopsis sp.]HVV13040.1 hypothetical protein [Amycolatopsis sp.]
MRTSGEQASEGIECENGREDQGGYVGRGLPREGRERNKKSAPRWAEWDWAGGR